MVFWGPNRAPAVSPQVPWMAPARGLLASPGARRGTEGAERGRPRRAANRPSGDAPVSAKEDRPPPAAPPTPKMGLAGQAGISMQAVCRPCRATRPPPGGCADNAVCPPPNTPPGLGVTLCPPPEMEALTPPLFLELLARRAQRPALCPATLPCAGVTACPPLTSWDPQPGCPAPIKGGQPQSPGWAPPHLYLLQRETYL